MRRIPARHDERIHSQEEEKMIKSYFVLCVPRGIATPKNPAPRVGKVRQFSLSFLADFVAICTTNRAFPWPRQARVPSFHVWSEQRGEEWGAPASIRPANSRVYRLGQKASHCRALGFCSPVCSRGSRRVAALWLRIRICLSSDAPSRERTRFLSARAPSQPRSALGADPLSLSHLFFLLFLFTAASTATFHSFQLAARVFPRE